MQIKLFDYQIVILKEIFKKYFVDKFSSFEKFLKYYPYKKRSINVSGEYLLLKHLRDSKEDNVELCKSTIIVESKELKNSAEFIVWIGSDSILIEGYSFEDRWLKSDSKIYIINHL